MAEGCGKGIIPRKHTTNIQGAVSLMICSLLRIQKRKTVPQKGAILMRKRNISPERLIEAIKEYIDGKGSFDTIAEKYCIS
ncbi:MAG: hypothetical protein IJQ71_10115, partial [Clostridia bacterium]|nr:hypothetical protein [Clostridia bacterium]